MVIEKIIEIEETFSNLEEIKKKLEEGGFVCRISFDEADEDDDFDSADFEVMDFAAEADPKEIEMLEAELAGDDDKDEAAENEAAENETDDELKEHETVGGVSQNGQGTKNLNDAEVVYFDLFKKKVYTKTLIFQKEEEEGSKTYKLIGFCEAPMG